MSTAVSSEPVPKTGSGLSFRAVAIGAVLTAFSAAAIPYSDNRLQGTWISCCHLPIITFCLFLVLVGVFHALTKRFFARHAFSVRELMVIYIMMLVGAGIPSFQLTEYLFPTLTGARYFATPENKWAETFFRYIPGWLAPTNDFAVRAFYEGLRPGEMLPWRPWVVPLAAWTTLALIFFWTMTCLTVALRRQWIENEHLLFPLVQLPLDMVEHVDRDPLSPFLRSKLMWIGAAIPTLIHSWNGVHRYFPAVPAIPLSWNLNQYFQAAPWNNVGMLVAIIHFSIIGFAFLLATDLSFSLWFFFIVFNLMSVALYVAGLRMPALPDYPTRPECAMQMLGAFFMVCGYILYLLRGQLDHMVGVAFGTKPAPARDADEPLPYRVAVWGFILGMAGIAIWCSFAGVRAWLALASFSLLLVVSLVLTRLVSEGGLLFIQAPFRPTDIYAFTVGTSWISPRELTIHAFLGRIFMLDLRTFIMPSFMDGFKIAHDTGIPARELMRAIAISVVVSILFSYGSMMWISYHYGAITGSGWFCQASPRQPFTTLANWISNPRKPTAAGWILILVGGTVTYFLSLARTRLTWWPFHPLGYAMGPSWPMIQLWFSTLIGWVFKIAVMRYATVTSYRKARQFFLGLVVGEFMTAGIWVVISAITATRGTRFFLF